VTLGVVAAQAEAERITAQMTPEALQRFMVRVPLFE